MEREAFAGGGKPVSAGVKVLRAWMLRGIVLAVAAVGSAQGVGAATISVTAPGDPNELLYFRDLRGTNSSGLIKGSRLTVGFNNVTPRYDEGTTIEARQGDTVLPLVAVPTTQTPNAFVGTIPYDDALTGSWTLTLRNGQDELVVVTPPLGSVPEMRHVSDMQMMRSGPAAAPSFTLRWVPPAGIDDVSVTLVDLERRVGGLDFADRIHTWELASDATSFTLPWTLPSGQTLKHDGLYSLEVKTNLRWTGEHRNPSGSSRAGAILSQTRTFFDFSTGALPELPPGESVYLPSVEVTTSGPVFNFNNAVLAGRISYYDPFFAIGYDYAIGAGDPRFNSFVLPGVGSGAFDLYLHDGTDYLFEAHVAAGVEYAFAPGGVDRFRILGLDVLLQIDPNDATAFVTGLSFVDDGRFTGTMAPVTAPIPLPPAAALGLAGTMMLIMAARRRDRSGSSMRG